MADRKLLVDRVAAEQCAVACGQHLSSLDFGSDFRCFLEPGVNDGDHRLGMRRLWSTSTLFGRSDGLDVYCGDYRCKSAGSHQPDSPTKESHEGKEIA